MLIYRDDPDRSSVGGIEDPRHPSAKQKLEAIIILETGLAFKLAQSSRAHGLGV